MITIKTKNIKR